jgi:hypothetical protein
MFRTEAERSAYYKGIRAAVAWLHAEALTMNDPHARSVLNSAGFHLGQAKPNPAESSAGVRTTSPQDQSAHDEPTTDRQTLREIRGGA